MRNRLASLCTSSKSLLGVSLVRARRGSRAGLTNGPRLVSTARRFNLKEEDAVIVESVLRALELEVNTDQDCIDCILHYLPLPFLCVNADATAIISLRHSERD